MIRALLTAPFPCALGALIVIMTACAQTPPATEAHRNGIRAGAESPTVVSLDPDVQDAVVQLGYPNGSGFCTGTLITRRLVLTAAHCVFDFTADAVILQLPDNVGIRVGPDGNEPKHNLCSLDFACDEEINTVVAIHPHPAFEQSVAFVFGVPLFTAVRDLALIELREPYAGARPLPLWNGNGELVGLDCDVAGYGTDADRVNERAWGAFRIDSVNGGEIVVVGTGDQRVDHGDSGGPLIGSFENEARVVGVDSSGNPSMNREFFASVAFNQDWLIPMLRERCQSDCGGRACGWWEGCPCGDCGRGETCDSRGRCVAGKQEPECVWDDDCGSCLRCEAGRCEPSSTDACGPDSGAENPPTIGSSGATSCDISTPARSPFPIPSALLIAAILFALRRRVDCSTPKN